MGSTGIIDETIILNEETVSIKEKLAFSNGLADSVKLGVLERMMDEHIDKVKDIPASLMSEKKVALSRKETLSLTGELLHFRAQLNLNSDLIDTPDIYWSEPKLEDLYLKISRVLETRRRTAILNKKLDYAKEMAQVLSEHLAEKHGLKLEWGIIALIAVEVAFETFHLIEKLN
jgi:required for meiotic nuclear division protein 1